MQTSTRLFLSAGGLCLGLMVLAACGGDGSSSNQGDGGGSATITGYQIAARPGSSLAAVAGDAVQLEVVATLSDGTTQALASGTTVSWTAPPTIKSLSPDDTTSDSPVPAPGAQATGFFVDNEFRDDASAALAGSLFVLDPGTAGTGSILVSATVSAQATPLTATVTVGATPAGDKTRGEALYTANCATCHGTTADGSPANPDGTTYTLAGTSYPFPAPGLNNAPGAGNLGGDPDWNAAVLAVAARSDADDGGVSLRAPMPNWISSPNVTTNKPLTTQDFADLYAYLVSETR